MASLLDVGAVLFALAGAFQFVIGILTAFLGFPVAIVGLSARTDAAMWGSPSATLLQYRVVHDLRTHHVIVIASLLCGLGVMQTAVAWVGVRSGEAWAIAALTACGAIMLPWWIAMVVQFRRSGVKVRLGDVQPFVWVHVALWIPAVAFSWAGLLG